MDELAPFERVQQQMPVPQILKETAEVDLLVEYVAAASAVTDTAPAPVTENVARTRAVTFDETAPVIKYVAPSPAVSNREEEIIEKISVL